jgi:hypothetical protein
MAVMSRGFTNSVPAISKATDAMGESQNPGEIAKLVQVVCTGSVMERHLE